jgi:hypothetical protein
MADKKNQDSRRSSNKAKTGSNLSTYRDINPVSESNVEPARQRKRQAYRPPESWQGGAEDNSNGSTEQPDAPKRRKRQPYRPPPNSPKDTTTVSNSTLHEDNSDTVVSVMVMSTLHQPVGHSQLQNVCAQEFVHGVETLVIRSERDSAVSNAISRLNVREVDALHDKLVTRSLFDKGIHQCKGEFIVLLATDLSPEGTGWLDALIGPMLDDQGIVATLGVVRADPTLPPYEAYRFEATRNNPLDFIAFRAEVWKQHSVRDSGHVGHRWLERIREVGRVPVIDAAVSTGPPTVADNFGDIVNAAFTNTPKSIPSAAATAVRETFSDWEEIKKRGLDDPAAAYVRAGVVRIAENIGITGLRRFFRSR